jgi:phospholipase/carboxylesterase
MTWIQFPHGFRLDPIAKGSTEALVILLHDLGASAASITPVALRWGASVPTAAFIALDGIEQPARPSKDLPLRTRLDRDARAFEPLIEHQLGSFRLDASRLVLVGFGYGGTLALHMLLRQGWSRAGVLAFAAQLIRPLPRILSVDHKVRLIDGGIDGDDNHSSLRDDVALLSARGIDTRGVLLDGSALSDEAIRHGAAYLGELVATAYRGSKSRVAMCHAAGHCR